MIHSTDMIGNNVVLNNVPRRIISVVPSQTELLYDLGLEEEVIGITKFCVHPQRWFRNKVRVGGTKQLHIDRIRNLQPDLIIANKEENTKEQIEALSAHFPVWVSDITTIDDALQMIREVGLLTCTQENARQLAENISHGFIQLPQSVKKYKVVYMIWYNPWMAAGSATFIDDMIHRIGWENALTDYPRYPEMTLDTLRALDPDIILLSSEPYPFKERHISEIRSVLPQAKVMLVDGEMFSWYGSRMLKAISYFTDLLHEVIH